MGQARRHIHARIHGHAHGHSHSRRHGHGHKHGHGHARGHGHGHGTVKTRKSCKLGIITVSIWNEIFNLISKFLVLSEKIYFCHKNSNFVVKILILSINLIFLFMIF